MSQRILNIVDVELQPRPSAFAATGPAAAVFDARMGQVATRLGAQKLGYNITAVPPGKAAFPLHCHRVNEEMFLVLQGSGEVRIGSEELRYLAVSTKQTPEICDYPDSGKFGVLAEYPSGPDGTPQGFRYIGKPDLAIGYWDGEGD
jgi:uncharacterized cupin superfamily protein